VVYTCHPILLHRGLREALKLSRWRIQPILTKVSCGNLFENYCFTQPKKREKDWRIRLNAFLSKENKR
jgi:hypothetical protein